MLFTRIISRNRIRSSSRSSCKFACSSFRDINSLFANEANVFHRVLRATAAFSAPPPSLEPPIALPGTEDRIVVYFTSLRVVRRTFEDCRAVRSIIKSFRVAIDERDVSMDCRFVEELQNVLGLRERTKIPLPRVFVGGRYIGGAEEINQLHETGELRNMVSGLMPEMNRDGCDVCGDNRFILCDECNGSHKCYRGNRSFRACAACNENGLIRCPSCSAAPPILL